MNKKFILELEKALPEWVSRGFIGKDQVENIREFYRDDKSGWRRETVFSVISSILIGFGIISIIAYNWSELAKGVKILLTLLLLIFPQIIAGWVIWKGNKSAGLREGISIILTLCVGASISLIAQIYHLPSDMANFFLVWSLLIFPLIYLLDSKATALLYFAGITAWASFAQIEGGQAMLFWPLVLLLVPYYYMELKKDIYSKPSIFLTWAAVLSFTVSIGITLEKVLPGLWIIIYSGYFSILYLLGRLYFYDMPCFWRKPLHTGGCIGILFLSFYFTYTYSWKNIGWDHYRNTGRFHEWAAWPDYILTVLLILFPVYLMVRYILSRNKPESAGWILPFPLISILSPAGYLIVSAFDKSLFAMILFNLFAASIGIATLLYGLKEKREGMVNGGVLIILALIAMRFFDMDVSFLGKGVFFIVCGILFLAANRVLSGIFKNSLKESSNE